MKPKVVTDRPIAFGLPVSITDLWDDTDTQTSEPVTYDPEAACASLLLAIGVEQLTIERLTIERKHVISK